jgi:hypothetical protein
VPRFVWLSSEPGKALHERLSVAPASHTVARLAHRRDLEIARCGDCSRSQTDRTAGPCSRPPRRARAESPSAHLAACAAARR